MATEYHPENVSLAQDGRAVRIIDQTLLPGRLRFIELSTPEECHDAIARLAVRGAPAIGVFAGFSLAVIAGNMLQGRRDGAFGEADLHALQDRADYLASSRPTAVNLSWALERMMGLARRCVGSRCGDVRAALLAEAHAIQQEDAAMCKSMAELGLGLIEDGWGLITHCNAATARPWAPSCWGPNGGCVSGCSRMRPGPCCRARA